MDGSLSEHPIVLLDWVYIAPKYVCKDIKIIEKLPYSFFGKKYHFYDEIANRLFSNKKILED